MNYLHLCRLITSSIIYDMWPRGLLQCACCNVTVTSDPNFELICPKVGGKRVLDAAAYDRFDT
jgi:hypothetical protein